MSSQFDHSFSDEFTGWDPERTEDYSREKIYGRLGDLNHATSVLDGLGAKTHFTAQPWMRMAISEVVGQRKDLWKGQASFMRDAAYHRLQDVKQFEWTTAETQIKLRDGLNGIALNEIISQEAHYQSLHGDMIEALDKTKSPAIKQILKERAAMYALDCLDEFWASEFKKLADS